MGGACTGGPPAGLLKWAAVGGAVMAAWDFLLCLLLKFEIFRCNFALMI